MPMSMKIITSGIDGKDYKEMINAFKETLPVDYQAGFIKEINNCSKELLIDNSLAIVLYERDGLIDHL